MILDQLGIPPPQSHWLNIFGSVYKLELPKDDILTVQQWEEHNKSAIFKSFLSLILDDMKFKVSEMNVKFVRSKDHHQQNRIVEPLITSVFDQQTQTKSNSIDCDAKYRATADFSQQHSSGMNSESNEAGNKKPKSQISMVFG